MVEQTSNSNGSNEYRDTMVIMKEVLREHQGKMKMGTPQLDWCDMAVQVNMCFSEYLYIKLDLNIVYM